MRLPLENSTAMELERAVAVLELAKSGKTVDFYEHVTAHKKVLLDGLLRKEPLKKTTDHITWGLSRNWAGIGAELPVEVHTITLGDEVAIVCLPGEVFVDLGLAIKRGSPYRTTLVIELSTCVETIYVPTRAAYAGGGYETTNSAVQPGSGEMLVEAALRLLRESASSK